MFINQYSIRLLWAYLYNSRNYVQFTVIVCVAAQISMKKVRKCGRREEIRVWKQTFQKAGDRPGIQWPRSCEQRVQACWRRIDCNSTKPSPSTSYPRNSLTLPSPFSLSLSFSREGYGMKIEESELGRSFRR